MQQCRDKLSQANFGDTVEMHSDQVLKSVSVSLGAMGIIYSITFKCVDKIQIAETRQGICFPTQDGQPFKFPCNFEDLYKKPDIEFFSVFIKQTRRMDPNRGLVYDAIYRQSRACDKSQSSNHKFCQSCCCCLPGVQAIPDNIVCQDDIVACCASSFLQNHRTCIPNFNRCVVDTMATSQPVKGPYYSVLQVSKGNVQ